MSETKANDHQVAGQHYKIMAIEPWDISTLLDLDFFQSEIMYYLTRWRNKGGLEDLKKARHWLDKYIEVESMRKDVGDVELKARILLAAYTKIPRSDR